MKIEIKPNDQSLIGTKIRDALWPKEQFVKVLGVGPHKFFGVTESDCEFLFAFSGAHTGGEAVGSYWELYEECKHEYFEGYIRLHGGDSAQDIRMCLKCKAIDYLKDIEREVPKKNPKLLSPALYETQTGKYVLSAWLYSERPTDNDLNILGTVKKIIWPALDANGKPIQYLVEEES